MTQYDYEFGTGYYHDTITIIGGVYSDNVYNNLGMEYDLSSKQFTSLNIPISYKLAGVSQWWSQTDNIIYMIPYLATK